MNDHIAVAVVGCGYWGENLVRNFHQLGRLRVICDVDRGRLEQLQKKYEGVAICDSYEELFRREDIEGIVIAAPAAQHFSLAKRALSKSLFPFTWNMQRSSTSLPGRTAAS